MAALKQASDLRDPEHSRNCVDCSNKEIEEALKGLASATEEVKKAARAKKMIIGGISKRTLKKDQKQDTETDT